MCIGDSGAFFGLFFFFFLWVRLWSQVLLVVNLIFDLLPYSGFGRWCFFYFVLRPMDLIARIYTIFTNGELNYIGMIILQKGRNLVKSYRDQAGNTVWARCTTKSFVFHRDSIQQPSVRQTDELPIRRPTTGFLAFFSYTISLKIKITINLSYKCTVQSSLYKKTKDLSNIYIVQK